MILKAYTIAPLDESGGHLNPHAGYHYHAATGKTKELKQEDGHASQIGYVIDGFPLFSYDKEAKLDECGGHYDKNRKYHYHAGEAGSNQVIKALKGATVLTESDKKHPPRGERPHNHDRGKPHKH